MFNFSRKLLSFFENIWLYNLVLFFEYRYQPFLCRILRVVRTGVDCLKALGRLVMLFKQLYELKRSSQSQRYRISGRVNLYEKGFIKMTHTASVSSKAYISTSLLPPQYFAWQNIAFRTHRNVG